MTSRVPLTDVPFADVAAACDRLESSAETEPATPKPPARKRAKGKAPKPADELAYATLDVREWAALVNPLGPCSCPLLRACRNAIATACKDKRGMVTIWHPVSGWCALLTSVLKSGRGCREAARLVPQISRTRKW